MSDDAGAVAFSDKTVQVYGTFGSGGNVIIQGSMNGTNWATLNDPLGTALGTITDTTVYAILENPRYIRPFVSAGTGVSLTVRITGRAIIQKS